MAQNLAFKIRYNGRINGLLGWALRLCGSDEGLISDTRQPAA